MKKYCTEAVTMNGTPTLLHTVEMPPDGKLNMPQNTLGYYEGKDGQLYYPVNPLNKTFMGSGTLRELTWHGIRNLQRNLTEDGKDEALSKTRRLHLLHEMLLGDDAFVEKLAVGLCQVQGLNLLLEIRKEPLHFYQAETNDTININGVPVDREDLLLALKEAADWYIWESDQPDQWFRQGWLLRYAVYALSAANDLQGVAKEETAREIAERINANHPDDCIPEEVVLVVMACKEIPANPESLNV